MSDFKEQYWKYSLLIIIIILGGIVFKETLPFLSGVLGACTVYVLVRRQMSFLSETKKMRRSIAATIILVEVSLIFLVPAFFVIWLLVNRLQSVNLEPSVLIKTIQHLIDLIQQKTGYDLLSGENLTMITSNITGIVQMLVGQVSSFLINSFVLLFVLYFMLLGGKRMESYVYDILPFRNKNKKDVIKSAKVMVTSNAIGIPLLALIQGFIAMIGYLIFGTPDPVIFGFLTCFATILPLIGTALIWFPLAAYLALTGDWAGGIGLAIYALVVISNVDNLVRFLLQKKLADTHPMVTIFGVILGLSLFGFWGVIFGPLLLSLFLLCFDMFKRDYIDDPK
ncbi:AI-2E family transporter [Dysgonomonas sp. HGC4]|uniref:AI-2E family transporter n=1 Tax=Dysgonomonas sp. HGC4 TaxID=1658009 RepID=UPI0006818E9D|nr:AI-2E family transporter [Dysgonomonas sp. HGC4]MBD8346465.1 AI-2E family transporter [Dysgonomonas sp. HGC4]